MTANRPLIVFASIAIILLWPVDWLWPRLKIASEDLGKSRRRRLRTEQNDKRFLMWLNRPGSVPAPSTTF
jgi:hypothetical protein